MPWSVVKIASIWHRKYFSHGPRSSRPDNRVLQNINDYLVKEYWLWKRNLFVVSVSIIILLPTLGVICFFMWFCSSFDPAILNLQFSSQRFHVPSRFILQLLHSPSVEFFYFMKAMVWRSRSRGSSNWEVLGLLRESCIAILPFYRKYSSILIWNVGLLITEIRLQYRS